MVVIDQSKLHTLNPVGSFVWALCDGRSLAALVEAVQAEFEVAEDRARNDVSAFVEELHGLGALELQGADR